MSATSLVSNQNQPSPLIDLDAVKARQQGAWSSGDCIRSQSSGDEKSSAERNVGSAKATFAETEFAGDCRGVPSRYQARTSGDVGNPQY